MRKRTEGSGAIPAKTGRIDAACARYGVGKNTMRQIAAEAGAIVRIGRSWLVNYSKLDEYVDSLTDRG